MKIEMNSRSVFALMELTGAPNAEEALAAVCATYRTIRDAVDGEMVTIIDRDGKEVVLPLTMKAALEHAHESERE